MSQAWTPVQSHVAPMPGTAPGLDVRRIGVGDVREALAQGWRDFLQTPTHLMFLVAIYPIVGFVLGREASGDGLLPLLWPLVAGGGQRGPPPARRR